MERLNDRIAIVTGAGQGIGKALALGLAGEGAQILVADINEESAARYEVRSNRQMERLWPTAAWFSIKDRV